MKRREALAGLTGGLAASVAAGCSVMQYLPGRRMKNPDFKIIGYCLAYNGTPPRPDQYRQLTHVIFSFIRPTPGYEVDNTIKNLQELSDSVHEAGAKAMVAIGGGAYGDGSFPAIAASPDLRKKFLDSCMKVVDMYTLDGIDLDWEFPNAGAEAEGYSLMMSEFSKALHSRGGCLSAAVNSTDLPKSIAKGSSVIHDVDFLNVMVYDRGKPHSTYQLAEDSIKVWCGDKGLPKEKYILGVPFYARVPKQVSYAQIVKELPEAANTDNAGGYDYNGKPTIIQKTKLALARGGGIMIWEIKGDAPGDASLLTTIYNTVRK